MVAERQADDNALSSMMRVATSHAIDIRIDGLSEKAEHEADRWARVKAKQPKKAKEQGVHLGWHCVTSAWLLLESLAELEFFLPLLEIVTFEPHEKRHNQPNNQP